MTTYYYLVLVKMQWDQLRLSPSLSDQKLKADAAMGLGFAPIFLSEEEALKHYPDALIARFVVPTAEEGH